MIAPALMSGLAPLHQLAGVAGVRVIGAQAAICFADASGAPDADRVRAVQKAALADHMLVYAGGMSGEALMLVPPFIIAGEVLAKALDRLREIIAQS